MQLDLSWPTIRAVLSGLGLFVLGMVVYCIFIFSFYKQVSKRLLFGFKEQDCSRSKHPRFMKVWCRFTYALKYLFGAPVFLFLWFAFIAALLLLMQRDIPVNTALLIAFALLATIRITAYYDEELSIDVAKILPLALLALFLVDMDLIQLPIFVNKLKEVGLYLNTLVIYFLFTVVLELLLRVYDALANRE
jgi:hypothetical protein